MTTRLPTEVPDGGWGWVIVLAAFLMSALVFGVIRSFGVFFVPFVEYFSEVSSSVSWITSMAVAIQQFFSPIASALSNYFGARPVVMMGAFLSSLGLMLACLATSLTHLYLSIGLLSGWLRDATGNYTASFVVAGTFLLLGSLVLFGIPSALSCSCLPPARLPRMEEDEEEEEKEEERKSMAVSNGSGLEARCLPIEPSNAASINSSVA